MDSYQHQIQRHLTAYKRARLCVNASGTYHYRGKDVTRSHILPRDLRWLNLLEPFRAEIRAYLAGHPEVKPHKYFHHLNSSQAFAFNLFFPFFDSSGADAEAFLRAVAGGGTAPRWGFEHVPEANEGTNVDVTWWAQGGAPTYCEVKLSEADFGKAEFDKRHLAKLETIYRPALEGHVDVGLLDPPQFFARYQILRNLWLAARDPAAHVVFLLPRANKGLWPKLKEVLERTSASLRGRVRLQAIEDTIDSLVRETSPRADLSWYARMLAEKYLPKDLQG